MNARYQRMSREELNAGFNRLKAIQSELFTVHGIKAYIDGCRLKSEVPGGKCGEFDQIQLVDGVVVWGVPAEVECGRQ